MNVGELDQQVSAHAAPLCRVDSATAIPRYARRIEILFVCTANICRSPMAEVLMAKRIAELLAPARVASAGLLEGGRTSPPEVVELMVSVGVDLSERASRQVSVDDLDRADLVLTMERQQLREVAVMTTTTWPKTFTMKELVRRGATVGGRLEGEAAGSWIARAHAGREPADLIDRAPMDEVADPFGGTFEEYAATKIELEDLVDQLGDLLFVPGAVPAVVLAESPSDPGEEADAPADQQRGRSRFGLVR
jgi:protein-tyrosine phosphatase